MFYGRTERRQPFCGIRCSIDADFKPSFKTISDRICVTEVTIPKSNHKIVIVTAYAPTLNCPDNRELFSEQIHSVISKEKKSKNLVILFGYFNAKTGTGYQLYKENIGKYGKGKMNNNG